MRARREERWHEGAHGAIARCGQGKAWHTVAGTGMGVGATSCPRVLTRFCSLLQAVRLRRKPRHPCSVKRRSWEHTELCVRATFLLRFLTLQGESMRKRQGRLTRGVTAE